MGGLAGGEHRRLFSLGRDESCALTRLGQEAEHQILGRFDFKESDGLRKSLKWIEQGGPTV